MKQMRFRSRGGFVMMSVTALSLGFLTGAQILAQSGKGGPNPEAGLSDEQRTALHQAAHDRNSQYLKDFVARRSDPHSLSVVMVESYAAVSGTVSEVVAASDLVIEGRVTNVEFAINPSGGLPLATATVEVVRNVRGAAPSTTVTVYQLGGPVANGTGGALAELDADPLILPGDHVVLLLVAEKNGSGFRTVPGPGVMTVASDGSVTVHGEDPFAAQLNGESLDVVVRLLAGG